MKKNEKNGLTARGHPTNFRSADGYSQTEVIGSGAVVEWLCSGLQIREQRFESAPRLHNLRSALVQLVERWTVNPYVAGSSPAGGANSGSGCNHRL